MGSRFKHFMVVQLELVNPKSEFRYNGRWYEKLDTNLCQETRRNTDCKWLFLPITQFNCRHRVAVLEKD